MNVKPLWNIILNACQLEAQADKKMCDLVGFLICQSIYSFQEDIFVKICFFSARLLGNYQKCKILKQGRQICIFYSFQPKI